MQQLVQIQMSAGDVQEVWKLLGDRKKIQAIKLIRTNGLICGEKVRQPGLREAKVACDNMQATGNIGVGSESVVIHKYLIKSVKIDGPQGELELDIENLQLNFLTRIDQLGISEVGRMLELVQYIREWQHPTKKSSVSEVGPEPAD